MSITIKQLEILANHFHFDMNEAREIIGIELKKRGSVKSSSSIDRGNYKPVKEDKPVKPNKPVKPDKPVKEEKKKRGPTGYNLFVREKGISFKSSGAAWKALSDKERDYWNAKSKE